MTHSVSNLGVFTLESVGEMICLYYQEYKVILRMQDDCLPVLL